MTQQTTPSASDTIPLPVAATLHVDFGFIGRDNEIHLLDRVLQQQSQAGLVVHGVAGVGKTTLIQGYLQWLQQSGGLKANIFWFRIDEIRSFENMVNQIVEGLFGAEVLTSPMQQKLDNLCQVFLQNPFIMVWDNFESACGIEDLDVMPTLSADDRNQLKAFLQRLHQGKTKVVIASRLTETWLSETECARLPLRGLQGEDRQLFCDAVALHFDLHLDYDDAAYCELMDKLDGHPLAMRVVLLKLDETPADHLLQEYNEVFDDAEPDKVITYTVAALRLLESSFPPEYTAVLQFISLHHRYVQLNTLIDMMKNSDLVTGQITIKGCITVLEHAGLMHAQEKDIYTMHSALNEYLRRHHPAESAVLGAFVDLMGHFSDHLAPKELAVQRAPFYIHSANFHYALFLAKQFNMDGHVIALTQSLAVFSLNDRDLEGARRLFESLIRHYSQHNDDLGLTSCYLQLGRIAQERRDFVLGEQWYLRALAIKEKLSDKRGIANSYAQLGALARQQQNWIEAAQWFVKAAVMFNKNDDMDSVSRVANIYLTLLQQSDVQTQTEIKLLWQQSGLEPTAQSIEALNETPNKTKNNAGN